MRLPEVHLELFDVCGGHTVHKADGPPFKLWITCDETGNELMKETFDEEPDEIKTQAVHQYIKLVMARHHIERLQRRLQQIASLAGVRDA